MKKIIIAIDGFSSCGKSTLAKALAARLGYSYIDSGAMYRAVTLYFLDHNVDLDNEQAISEALDLIHIHFHRNIETGANETWLNDLNVEQAIRTMRVSSMVSPVSALKQVRQAMVKLQRKAGAKKGIVMDGRDIGTNVFPAAELKIFMTANLEVRAQRRFLELVEKGEPTDLSLVYENLQSRDYTDTHRETNPLAQAVDAYVLDNSDLTQTQQLDIVLQWVSKIV